MPVWLTAQIKPTLDGVVHTRAGFVWLGVQYHACILQALAAFAMVAGFAAGNYIGPLVSTTPTARDDVIDCQIFIDATAILTGEAVADEYLTTAELDAWPGPTHKCPQSYDRGHLKGAAGRMEELLTLLQHIGLAAKDEHEGSSNVAHVQWFIVLVEHQYGVVHPAEPFGSGLPRFPFAPGTECNRCDFSEGDISKRWRSYQGLASETYVNSVILCRQERPSGRV